MNPSGGLTLIELLIALALLATVTLLLTAAVHGLRRTADGLLSRQKTLSEPEALLRDLVREVEGAWNPSFPERPAFRIRKGEIGQPELWTWSFFTDRPDPGSEDPSRFLSSEVLYSAVETGTGVDLLRAERAVRDPPGDFSPKRVRLRGVRSLDVVAGSGNVLETPWPPKKDGTGLPHKARIRIVTAGSPEKTLSAEILLPCSLSIAPTVQRQADIP
jgi:hypothetical protein